MASNLRFGEDYLDLSMFDPKTYMDQHWEEAGKPMLLLWNSMVDNLTLKNQRLLDVGTGPCLTSVTCISRVCDSITLAEYVPANREELYKWIQRAQAAFDWTPVFRVVAEMEGDKVTPSQIEERLRSTIQPEVLSFDVHKDNPLEPATPEPFDIITTQLCLEAACLTEDEYQKAICNISKFLKPGGSLFIFGCIDESFYTVGKTKFKTLKLTQDSVRRMVENAEFTDIKFDTHIFQPGVIPADLADVTGLFLLHAVKK